MEEGRSRTQFLFLILFTFFLPPALGLEVEHEELVSMYDGHPFVFLSPHWRYVEVSCNIPAIIESSDNNTVLCCEFQQNAGPNSTVWIPLKLVFCRPLEVDEFAIFEEFRPSRIQGWDSSCDHRLLFNSTATESIAMKVVISTEGLIGPAQAWIGLAMLVVMYICVGFEFAHRSLLACVAAFTTFIFLVLMDFHPYLAVVESWIDPTTVLLLFSMMILVSIFSLTGVFEWLAVKCYQLSRGSVRRLAIIMLGLTVLVSAFLPNITVVLLMSPVTFRICDLLELSPVPFAVAISIMSNVGGVATLIGDPPNIIIGKAFNLSFVSFLVNLAPCVVITCAPVLAWFFLFYRKQIAGTKKLDVAELLHEYKIKDKKLLIKCLSVMGVVVILFFLQGPTGLDPAYSAVFGAVALMLLCDRKRIDETLHKVEWETLLWYGALFVLIGGLSELGMIRLFAKGVKAIVVAVPLRGQLTVAVILIMWASGLASAFVDNGLWAITMVPVLRTISRDLNLPLTTLAWALAFGTCYGGNATLIGASTNVVTADLLKGRGHVLSFGMWAKVGAPATVIMLLVSTVYMLIVYVAIGYVWVA